MPIYYYEINGGSCALHEAPNIDAARKYLLRTEGSNNLGVVRPATEKDIDWIGGMGGWVPDHGKRTNPESKP